VTHFNHAAARLLLSYRTYLFIEAVERRYRYTPAYLVRDQTKTDNSLFQSVGDASCEAATAKRRLPNRATHLCSQHASRRTLGYPELSGRRGE